YVVCALGGRVLGSPAPRLVVRAPVRHDRSMRLVGVSEGVALLLAGVLIFGCGERAALVPPTSRRAAPSDATARPRFIPRSVSFISPSLGWAWGPAAHSSRAGVLARTDDG